jgi:tryptophan synthase beta chain
LKKQIGREAPDYLIACVGGGSNAAGTFYRYLENEKVKLYVAEAAGVGLDNPLQSAATIHLGREGVLHGSKTMVMMDADGQIAEAFSISAGLDYPGIGPLHAYLAETGRSKVFAITDKEAMDAALNLTQKEGIIPAIESAHALAVLDKCRFKLNDVVVITVSGRGDKDMNTFAEYFNL